MGKKRLSDLGSEQEMSADASAFRAAVRTAAAVDLTVEPLVRDRPVWTHRVSYQGTQAFGVTARAARIQLIRYESVRDPEHAACVAVLDAQAFGRGKPHSQQTWFIAAARARVRCAKDERGAATWEFTSEQLL